MIEKQLQCAKYQPDEGVLRTSIAGYSDRERSSTAAILAVYDSCSEALSGNGGSRGVGFNT